MIVSGLSSNNTLPFAIDIPALFPAAKPTFFDSSTKYASGSGWPSFYQPVADGAVEAHEDGTYGMRRTEVVCAACDGHLGHVFPDGPEPTGLRYCIDGVALQFIPKAA